MATLSSIPENPWQEFVIAISGPLVNLVIALGLRHWAGWWPSWHEIWNLEKLPDDTAGFLLLTNLRLMWFNLLPAFPMDGGRILRSMLATVLPHARATELAAAVGRVMAIAFVVYGYKISYMLVVIGWFIFVGAGREARMVRARAALAGLTVRDILRPPPLVMTPDARLSDLVRAVHAASGADVFVMVDGRPAGIVPSGVWLDACYTRRDNPALGDIMLQRFLCLSPSVELGQLVRDSRAAGQTFFPVLESGLLIGAVTADDVQRARGRRSGPPRAEGRGASPGAASTGGARRRYTIDFG